MRRTGLFLVAGLVVSAAIHIAIVLLVPLFAMHDAWTAAGTLGADGAFHIMPSPVPGQQAADRDPDLMEAVCRFDLGAGPVRILASLPDTFWSVALFDRRGRNLYSLNHSSIAQLRLDLTVATPGEAATLPAAPDENALVAALPIDSAMVVLRVFVPDDASVPGIAAALASAECNASS